jgi:8-oxo-dGTP pyrophosphatase MutT (NUDIX family)
VIRAAGGVVVRVHEDAATPEILVVHRVAHDDWSLPKGHLDPGEEDAEAALREVAEETGVSAEIVSTLPPTEHRTLSGTKRVTWFLMRPVVGDPATRAPDTEVDLARYVPIDQLAGLLTYPTDLELARLAAAASTGDTPDPR